MFCIALSLSESFSAERGTAALQEANPTMPDDEKGGAADEDKNIEIWKIKKLIKSLGRLARRYNRRD